jgi:hypothetical protein
VNIVAAIVAQSAFSGAVPEYFAKSLSVEFVVASSVWMNWNERTAGTSGSAGTSQA